MSLDFFLQPLDGGPRVLVGPGQTVIGRGPLLGITDKRVSRRHAILEVVANQLRIKPIHTNPCFHQSSEKSQLLPMKTHTWCWLNPGDSFSLLLNKYSFRVLTTQAEEEMECTLRNSQILEDDLLSKMQKSPVINLPDETPGALQLQGRPPVTEAKWSAVEPMSSAGACGDVCERQPHPAQRKRVLPAWMLAESLSDQNLSSPVQGGDKDAVQRSGKEGTCKDKTPVNITQHGRKRLISLGNLESMSTEQDPGKKCKSSDQEGLVVSSKEVPESLSSITLSGTDTDTVKTNELSNAVPIEELGEVSKYKTVNKATANKDGETVRHPESHSSIQSKSLPETSKGFYPESSSGPSSPDASSHTVADSVLGSSEESKVRRVSCMYGAKCYRKNPLHFQHFSHPGDSDYGDIQVTDEGVTGDRPECPYGASCYRKNPQHKMEYRHSALPVRVALDEDSDDVGHPSENDLNDSFPEEDEDEGHEPTDEDSDWQPGKDNEEKEDVEELLKAAKRFMKRKK
ncbi:aprataxin and PNK-like factor [Phodopus roborovskii]|uniref:Aprataxin and PNK-like factor n=1 Tax=Phodopus roborovskii TaxID=109678 RepID=A0AAV0A3H6_PHORO|nr:aprataxin and PNK-like factor [Phodopus roborovskii]CAH7164288.1 Aplf [Phodopus roborovskii]